MSQPGYTFTIFTSTRNRAHTLDRVFESLVRQSFRDFEWIVVDNGSTDGTAELVRGWKARAPFEIEYLAQENRGKHTAMNRAAGRARGRFFLPLDSDDALPEDALERMLATWESIPAAVRDGYAGVTGLCVDEHGALIGTPFPETPLDSNPMELFYRYRVTGEKAGFQRTDLMRQHPLPEIPGYSGFVTDGITWRAIGRRFKTRYVNEPYRIYWQDQAVSLSRPKRVWDDAPGLVLAYESLLNEDIGWLRHAPAEFLRETIRYVRFSFHIGRSIPAQLRALRPASAKLLWVAAAPAGLAVFLVERFGVDHYARQMSGLLRR
jgi:glycosyltransferase involved in cell wall biosynthesis